MVQQLFKCMIYQIAGFYLVTTIIYAFLAWSAFKNGVLIYKRTFGLLMLALMIYSLGSCLEPLIPDLKWMLFWNNFIYPGIHATGPLLLLLSLEYSGIVRPGRYRLSLLLFVIPAVTVVFKYLDSIFGLCYEQVFIMDRGWGRMIGFKSGPLYYFYFSYSILCILVSILMFVYFGIKGVSRTKKQTVAILSAVTIPFLTACIYFVYRDRLQIDIIPFTFLPASVLFFYGLHFQQFLKESMLSLHDLFGSMQTGFLLFNHYGELTEANRAAKTLLPEMGGLPLPCKRDLLVQTAPYLKKLYLNETIDSIFTPHKIEIREKSVSLLINIIPGASDDFKWYSVIVVPRNRNKLDTDKLAWSYQPDLEKLETCMRTMHPYLDPDLTLVKLSGILGINRTVLSKLINTIHKETFNDYINTYRIAEACQALLVGEKKIHEIVYYSGFNSRTAFYTAFHKNTGMTPREYVRSQR